MIKLLFRNFFCFSLVFSISACTHQTTTVSTENFDVITTDSLYYNYFSIDTIDVACKSEIDNCPAAKISYPIFNTPDVSLNAFLNAEINKQVLYASDTSSYSSVTNLLDTYFSENRKYKSNDATDAWYYENTISVYGKIGKYITIKSYTDSYEGGAHPVAFVNYKVYDLISKKELKLNELLNADDAVLLKIGEKYFRKNNNVADSTSLIDANYFVFGDDENYEDGPKYGKFRYNTNFALTKNGIEFEYNPYEIGPYAVGSSSFTIPYKDIQTYLKLKIW